MSAERVPQVLLLGNGINNAYGSISWNKLIEKISTNPKIPKGAKLKSPMPLQAILVTEDQVEFALKNHKQVFYGAITNEAQAMTLKALLGIGFDHIITTNYSYELEQCVQPDYKVTEQRLLQLMSHTDAVQKAENKYLLHTYNSLEYMGHKNKIWHIHGEARKPSGMILGHYYYANLLRRICDYLERQKDRYHFYQSNHEQAKIKSWIDAFILGDVYVLGFGYDTSEFDLWWLLNRKKREKAQTGKIYFFEPQRNTIDTIDEKKELLRVMGAEIIDLGYTRPDQNDPERCKAYQAFYRDAIMKITQFMSEST